MTETNLAKNCTDSKLYLAEFHRQNLSQTEQEGIQRSIQISWAPSIYVACLASYNNGYLHGCWIDALQDESSIYEDINKMLAKSPIANAEEWAIHDIDNFGSLDIGEYEGIHSVCEKAKFFQEHSDLGAAAMQYYGDLAIAEEALMEHYHGEWNSELEFSTELFDDLYLDQIPENIRFYVDYERFNIDLFIGDYFSLVVNNRTHVFSCH